MGERYVPGTVGSIEQFLVRQRPREELSDVKPGCQWLAYPWMGHSPFCRPCRHRFACFPGWCDRCRRPQCLC